MQHGYFQQEHRQQGAPFCFAPFRAFSRSFRGISRPFRAAIPGEKDAFQHFMPEVMNKHARHAQACMNSSKPQESAKTDKNMTSNKKVRVSTLQKISRSFPNFAYQNLNRTSFCVPLGGAGGF